MQVNEYDFKRINLNFKAFEDRMSKLEKEVAEFKAWYESKYKACVSESKSVEFHESLTDNQDAEE